MFCFLRFSHSHFVWSTGTHALSRSINLSTPHWPNLYIMWYIYNNIGIYTCDTSRISTCDVGDYTRSEILTRICLEPIRCLRDISGIIYASTPPLDLHRALCTACSNQSEQCTLDHANCDLILCSVRDGFYITSPEKAFEAQQNICAAVMIRSDYITGSLLLSDIYDIWYMTCMIYDMIYSPVNAAILLAHTGISWKNPVLLSW